MKTGIHPTTHKITANCTCGASFEVKSTLESIKVESCSKCHPHYTGKVRETSNSGRVARFRERQEAVSKSA